jgi:hypothetical protein
VRRTRPQRQESLKTLAERDDLNPQTVAKWKRRASVPDAPMGPQEPRSTGLTQAQDALGVACRRHTLLPLDDCRYALQASIPHLTRSTLQRCDQRHGLSRLPEVAGTQPVKRQLQTSPLGYIPMDLAEEHTAEGRLDLFGAIERASTLALAERPANATRRMAANCLRALITAVPDTIPTGLTDHGTPFTALPHCRTGADQHQAVQPLEG